MIRKKNSSLFFIIDLVISHNKKLFIFAIKFIKIFFKIFNKKMIQLKVCFDANNINLKQFI